MRYEIREISSPGGESRFEMDLDDPPAEGDVIDPGTMGLQRAAPRGGRSFQPENGRVTVTNGLSAGPLTSNLTCPGGQTFVLACVSYSNITLETRPTTSPRTSLTKHRRSSTSACPARRLRGRSLARNGLRRRGEPQRPGATLSRRTSRGLGLHCGASSAETVIDAERIRTAERKDKPSWN